MASYLFLSASDAESGLLVTCLKTRVLLFGQHLFPRHQCTQSLTSHVTTLRTVED